MTLRVAERQCSKNFSRCGPIPIDWLGDTGVPGTKSQGRSDLADLAAELQFFRVIFVVGIRYYGKGKTTPKQSWNKRCGDSGDN